MSQPLFQFDPSLEFAAFVNPKIADTQRLTASGGLAYPYRQLVMSYPGDTMKDQTIPGTTVKWNDSTECQGEIFNYYQAKGEANPGGPAFPPDLDAILKANAGPDEKWNGSYNNYGVPPGTFPTYPLAFTAEYGTGEAVEVFVP